MTEITWGDVDMVKDLLTKEPLSDYAEVNRNPEWLDSDSVVKYKGFSTIWGNFKHVSYSFGFITDDEKMIAEFEELFTKNREMFPN